MPNHCIYVFCKGCNSYYCIRCGDLHGDEATKELGDVKLDVKVNDYCRFCGKEMVYVV